MSNEFIKEDNSNSGKLGLVECVSILTGGMIGSAIFSLSGLTMYSAGPASMITWFLAGIIMMLYGMLVCELSCRYPQSGGVYVFPRKAFGGNTGKIWAWLSFWGSFVTNIIAIAFGAIYIGIYLNVAFPWAANYQIPLALAAILIAMFLNVIKFQTTGKINNIIVSFLIVTIFIYVFSAFFSDNFSINNYFPFFSQGAEGVWGIFNSISIAIIGYSSVMAMAFMVSEVKEPGKTVSRSMYISVLIVVVIYLLVIASTMGLIDSKYLADNPGMRFIPLFAACFTKMKNIPWLVEVVSISAVVALMTTILVCVSINARAFQAVTFDGILPERWGRTNKYGAPVFSVIVTCALAMGVACFPEMTMKIVNFGAIFNVFTIVITLCALIAARKTKIDNLTFVAPGGNYLPIIVLVILVLCNLSSIISGGWEMFFFTLGFCVLGLLIYYGRLFYSKSSTDEKKGLENGSND